MFNILGVFSACRGRAMGVPWAHLERVLAELWGHVGCAQAANSQSGHAPAKKRRDLCARVVKLVVVALALALAVVVTLVGFAKNFHFLTVAGYLSRIIR